MKSYSKFIIENKKGTAVASPSPGGDPLDPKGRRKIEKKFSNPSNPPKVANPEAPKPKPEGIRQADVSKKAATYRRAQRIKTATGGKTTGSLRSGNLSFPGDRSGATAKAKADIEARRGFSGTKSGGLKADETSKFVNRSVRQQRAVKQGIPDPFTSKTPAPADPFKGVIKAKPGKPSIPSPLEGMPVSKPKTRTTGAPDRSAVKQAVSDIRSQRSRLGITKKVTPKPKPSVPKPPKTVEQTPVNKYIRTMQDQGRPVDPDFIGAQGPKASGAKPEMVGGSTKPSGAGAKFRAQADAAKDISKARSADLDKALKNLVTSGDVKSSKPSGPSSPIGFRKFSRKASQITKTYKDAERNFGKPAKVDIKVPKPVIKPAKVSAADAAFNAQKALKSTEYTNYAVSGKGPRGQLLDKVARKRFKDLARTPFGIEKYDSKTAARAPKKLSVGGRLKGSNNAALALTKQKSIAPKTLSIGGNPELAAKVKKALPGAGGSFKKVRSGVSATIKPTSKLTKFARGAGRVGGPLLAVAGAGLDYADDRSKGYSRTSSALRTGAKHLGGAALGALGSVAGPLGTAAGYAAGHWLTSKVLDKFHKPKKPKKVDQTPKQRIASKVKNTVGAPVRSLTGAPPPKPSVKPVKTDSREYLKVNREERYISTLSDTMLKEGYTVDEVVEFLQCEDMDKVESILGSLTLTESVDADHPDLELVVERVKALTTIGSWLARQAGRLKNVFSKGASQATKVKPGAVKGTYKVKSTTPKGPGSRFRNKRVTGDVTPTLGSKLKTAAKVALPVAGAALLVKGIDDVMKDKPGLKDDPKHTNTTTGGGGDKEDGLSKGYGSRTRKYGWWQKSHASSPYVDSVSNYNNIRRNSNK